MIDMLEELLVLEEDRIRRKEQRQDTESWKRTMRENILTLRTKYVVIVSHCMPVYTFYIRIMLFFLIDRLCNDSVHTHT